MDLLQSYSSDESDEDERNLDNILHEPSSDYFNLYVSDSDDDRNELPDRKKIEYSVVKSANVLSEKAFGPHHLLGNKIREESGHVNAPRKLNVTDCDNEPQPSKKYKSRTHIFDDTLCAKNEPADALSSDYVHDSDEKTKFHESGSACKIENGMFDERDQISCHLTEERNCHLPKNFESFLFHTSSVISLKWCSAHYSHLLLTGSTDSTVKIWDMYLKRTVAQFTDNVAVKSVKWSLCGTKVIYGGYSKKAVVVDVQAGKDLVSYNLGQYITSLEVHPKMDTVFLVGIKNNVFAFDTRTSVSSPAQRYSAKCQDVLDIAFFEDGSEFVCSTEVVSRDCADRTLMVWDFATSAILSNQIYAECYTCPCVRMEPGGQHFIAQSNGDYIVMFKTKRPYKKRNRRYDEHKVSGYGVTCDFSPDGKYIASGDAGGGLYIYLNEPCTLAKKLEVKPDVPTVQVSWHPVLNTTLATASLDGSVQIWQ